MRIERIGLRVFLKCEKCDHKWHEDILFNEVLLVHDCSECGGDILILIDHLSIQTGD